MSYDTNNIFAKILRGEIPCHKVYEDEHTLAFMDVMPQADGHTLVIPKIPVAQSARCRSRSAGRADGLACRRSPRRCARPSAPRAC